MHRLIRRAVMVAGAAVVLLGLAAGVASAKGNPVLIWSPTTSAGSYSYGALSAGQAASQTFTLANSGSAATAALSITLSGSPAFTKLADTCTGAKVKADKSCNVIVAYSPAVSGENDTATLTATSGKPAVTTSLTLQGAAKASPAIATSPSAGELIGTTVTDSATVTGGVSPTGTIEFKLYGPSATALCSGTPVSDQEVAVAGNGSYASPSVTVAQAGTYWWTASYSGDANNNPATTSCGDESVTISKASPVIGTTSSFGQVPGDPMTDSATVTGGVSPTGTIEFKLYGPSATALCSGTPVSDQEVAVAGNGSYASPSVTVAQAGTYWWTASYSGDANNNPATTSCGDESVTLGPHLYWASPGTGTGAIYEANLDGSDPHAIVTGQSGLAGIAVTAGGLYWIAGDKVWTANLDGSNPRPIFSIEQAIGGTTDNTIRNDPVGLAVTASNVYWTDDFNSTVWEADLDGSNPHTIFTASDTSIDLADPEAIAVSASDVYWTDVFNRTVWEADLDGSDPHAIVTGQPELAAVAVTSSNLYWTAGGGVWDANPDGSNPVAISPHALAGEGLAVSSSNLYWSDPASGTITEADLAGNNPEVIVTGQNELTWAAVGPQ